MNQVNNAPAITGYRQLTPDEITAINQVKMLEQGIMQLIDHVKLLPQCDQRCAAIAATNIQQGFMWLVRSVARPE